MIIKTTFHGLKPYYQIAQQFDNLTAGLEIDCTDAAENGDTAAVLIRGVDGSSYPALSTYEDGILKYAFTAADLKTPGNIYVQLAIYGPAGEVKHSKLAALHVAQSIPGGEKPPEALTSWLAEAARTLENLKKYGSDAEKSAVAAALSEKNAAEAAEAAYNFASAAALSETSAKSQAEAATTAAAQAHSSASSAARDASGANTSARSAAESASTATAAASTATAKATAAAGSASAAQSAKTDAETAKASAESAKTAAETAQTAAEEARDASAASATSAAQSAQTAQIKAQEIAESADKINAVQKQADRTDRSLNALWKLNEGQTYDIETVEETGMNEAPSGAKYMTPEKIYGKTEQDGEPAPDAPQEIKSVESIEVKHIKGWYSHLLTDIQWNWLKRNESIWRDNDCITWVRTDLNLVFIVTKESTLNESDKHYYNMLKLSASGIIGQTHNNGFNGNNSTFVVLYAKGSFYDAYEKRYVTLDIDSTNTINIPSAYTERITEFRTITPPRPLNAIGEYKDVLDVTNGVWRYVFKEVSGGSLTWFKASAGEFTFRAAVPDFPKQTKYELPAVLTTDYRRAITQTQMANIVTSGDMIITCHNNANEIWINDGRFTALDAFRQAIADKTFIYASDAEVTIPIDPGDLEFLRELDGVPASDSISISDQSGNDVPWLNEYIISLREVVSNG